MSREAHVRFRERGRGWFPPATRLRERERVGVKFPRATRLLLRDVAGERVADQLNVLLDRGELAPLIMHHGPQAVVEDAFDVGDIALQRADRGGVLFGAMVMRYSPVLSVVAEAEPAAGPL